MRSIIMSPHRTLVEGERVPAASDPSPARLAAAAAAAGVVMRPPAWHRGLLCPLDLHHVTLCDFPAQRRCVNPRVGGGLLAGCEKQYSWG